MDWYAAAEEAARALPRLLRVDDRPVGAALVLGSGWGQAAEALGDPIAQIAMSDVPHLRAPVAPGHAGTLRAYDLDGGPLALAFLGRTHLYEGHGPGAVAHAVRTAVAAGARTVALTNANGSLRPQWGPGTGVIINDHLNLSGSSPLTGARFVDLTGAYSPRLRALARRAAPALVEGTYAMLRGPHYETGAEARAVRALGGDVLGMSTVLETIAAREGGAEVFALSVVTAVEDSPDQIDPDEVVEIAERAATALGPALRAVLAQAIGHDGSRVGGRSAPEQGAGR